jgi:hypothetical protein
MTGNLEFIANEQGLYSAGQGIFCFQGAQMFVTLKSSVCWYTTPYIPVKVKGCFGGTFRLHGVISQKMILQNTMKLFQPTICN